MSKHLSIAELARETGLKPATIRAWELRHDFPRPLRLPGGHRRYRPEDVDALRRVLAERAAGATLGAAIARARLAGADPAQSIFARVRVRWGEESQEVSKRTMVGLSHALEDELAVRAERGLLVGAFQERRFYEEAAARWRDLARSALRAVVFADFPAPRTPDAGPAEVPIPSGSPFEREWAIVYLAPRCSALLAGRELPGAAADGRGRRFELLWSVDPGLVREALGAAAQLAGQTAPSVALDLTAQMDRLPHPDGVDAGFVTALTNRMIAHLDR